MPHHYLLYWKPETADHELERGALLDHAASDQLGNVHVGDTIWIVTAKEDELYLLGSLEVAFVGDREAAARRLGTADLWEAKYYVVARAGSASVVRLRRIPLTILEELRFTSERNPSLSIDSSKVNRQRLRRMRELTEPSAKLLSNLCSRTCQDKLDFNSRDTYRRRDIHDRFGGQRQGGISTPADRPPNHSTALRDYFADIAHEEDPQTEDAAFEPEESTSADESQAGPAAKDTGNALETASGTRGFVASKNRHKFHRRDCEWAKYILHSPNLVEFRSYQEAKESGYKPCRTCCSGIGTTPQGPQDGDTKQ